MPDPEPGAGQVRVRVEVAAVTFMDVMRRSGSPIGPPASFPIVLGNGVAGVVDRVGPGVDESCLTTRVVTTTGGSGGYASLAVANAADLHVVPHSLDSRSAAAVLADGRTALGLFEAAKIRTGDVVVVTAAAGGVGSLLVQLAVAAGARVTGLVGSATKAESVGLDNVLNYRETGWSGRVPQADVVFDGVGGEITTALAARIRSGGRYLQHGAASGTWGVIEPRSDVDVIPLSVISVDGMAARALELTAAGTLKPLIVQTFPLAEAVRAHEAIEARTAIGKTLLILRSSSRSSDHREALRPRADHATPTSPGSTDPRPAR
ncbi:zinc-binding dehydrogenase [Kineosporia succinea]